jgi:hypothetical protein
MLLFSAASKTGCDKPIQRLREAFLLKDQSEHHILKISKELVENIQRYCEIHSVLLPECNVAMSAEAAFLTRVLIPNVLSITALNFQFLGVGFDFSPLICHAPHHYYSGDQHACDGRGMWHARR